MNWIEFAYPMMAAASLTLALIHFVVWLGRRQDYEYLLFVLIAVSVAAFAVFELLMIGTPDPERFAMLQRWVQVPSAVLLISMMAYVRVRFGAGNLALGAVVAALRLFVLVAAFAGAASAHYSRMLEMQPLELWGGALVYIPVGEPSPVAWVIRAAHLLLVLYLLGAVRTIWRRAPGPERRSALLVCGSMAFFFAVSAAQTTLVNANVLHMPYLINPIFLVVVLVMSYELGGDIVRAGLTSRRLLESEEQLFDSEMRVALAAEATGLGLWSWDVGRDRVWVSDNGRVLFDLGDEQGITFSRFLALLHPDDRERVQHGIHQSLIEGGAFQREYRIVRPDGNVRWIESRGRIKRDESGRALTFYGISLDVSGDRLGDQRFRVAVEAAPNGMLLVAGDGLIALANARVAEMFGYTADELVGRSVETLLPTSALGQHPGFLAAFASNPPVRPIVRSGRELHGQHRDGRQVPIEIGLNPVETPAGPFVLASVTDVSERVQHEREAAIQRNELAHLSRVAMLGELSGSLAHELNQPLAAILSNAQAALRFVDRPELREELRETLADIVENDKRAGEVIRRLRAMLKKEEVKHRRLDLNELVSDVLRLYRSDLLNRKVAIVLELAPEASEVEGDPVQLQQVLLNLLINACDAMDGVSEGRRLVIRTRVAGIQDDQVEVSVSDVGKGIASGQNERVFEAFVTSKKEGMGLGLAVCRTIIHAHHGRIWCENNAGSGAMFRFELARAEPRDPAPASVPGETPVRAPAGD